jgi:hypothetical protein
VKKGLGTLLAITLAVTVFVNPGAAPQAFRQPADSSQAPTEKKTRAQHNFAYQTGTNSLCKIEGDLLCLKCEQICPAQDLFETIGAFFGSRDENGKPTVSWLEGPSAASAVAGRGKHAGEHGQLPEPSAELRRHWEVPREARSHVRFIVALLPDPVHTHLSLAFDTQVDAIEQAIEQDGYLFARAAMPWDYREHDHPEPGDFRVRLLQKEYEKNREQLPGLMIFRKADSRNTSEAISPLFVFVIGETPTGGINKRQFQIALKAIESITSGTKRSTKQETLHIFGPTFSGSLYSLMFLLHQDVADTYPNVVIHSGTASSHETIAWFNHFLENPELLREKRELHVKFRTFQDSDCDDLIRFVNHVKENRYRPEDVALLSEDETAYGNLATQAAEIPQAPESPASETSSCGVTPLLHIHFPRDIAHFRSAYQHDVENAEPSEAGGKHQRLTLRSNLEDTGSDDDSVPQYSRLQTPLVQEAVLMGIISELRVHRTKFVVLQATNPLDTFFLGRYLRKSYPEGRLVTIGADLLFPREVDDPRLHGILAISAYPLFPGIDDAAAFGSAFPPFLMARHVFPSSYSVGSFNAMLSLLRTGEFLNLDTESGTAAQTAEPPCADGIGCEKVRIPCGAYAQYGWPALAGAPPTRECILTPLLWLTILGRNGYLPLALLQESSTPTGNADLSANLPVAQGKSCLGKNVLGVPLPWIVLCCICMAIAFSQMYLVFSGSLLARSETLANFAPLQDGRRNYTLLIGALHMVVMSLLLLWPFRYWWGVTRGDYLQRGVMELVGAIVVILVVHNWIDLRKRGAKGAAVVFVAAFAVAAVIVLGVAQDSRILDRGLESYRYMAITSGASQLMPLLLLLAGGIWWAWYTLAGLALLDKRGPRLPMAEDLKFSDDGPPLSEAALIRFRPFTEERTRTLRHVMRPADMDKRVILVPIVGVLLSLLVLGSRRPIRSVEGTAYDYFYWFVLTFSIFVLSCELGRLAATWMELRSLLLSLDRLPLRRGFERLKGFSWKPLWHMGGGSIWDFYRLVSRQLETLHFLKNLGAIEVELRGVIEKTDAKLHEISEFIKPLMPAAKPRRMSGRETTALGAKLEDLYKAIASTSGTMLKFLMQKWDVEKPVELFELPGAGAAERKSEFGVPAEISRVSLAEDFVCQVYLSFILSVIQRMRTLVMTVGGMFVFTLLSFSSYPFAGKSYFHSLMVGLFVIIVVTVGFVFAQMHRDATLSGITDTTPGELGFDFWLRLAAFVAVPLVSLLAAQFPEINSVLFSWLQPAYETLK